MKITYREGNGCFYLNLELPEQTKKILTNMVC